MKNIENILMRLVPFVEDGYNAFCEEFQSLIMIRIKDDHADILSAYIEKDEEFVKTFCEDKDISLISILNSSDIAIKGELGLKLIDHDIMSKLAIKISSDVGIKQLGIPTVSLTNGIEKCPWLALFGEVKALNWFKNKSSSFLKSLGEEHPMHKWTVAQIKAIEDHWVDPKDVKPNLENYEWLMKLPVPASLNDLVLKTYGNN